MHKILALSAIAAAFAGNALAQCSNYSNAPAGTQILQADDAIRTVGLPFSFPFNGVLYNQIVVSTNGWLKLGTTTNTANDLGESETLFLNNPITANNTNPRIAVCWDDLRPSGAGQGVFYSGDPTQATICWVNAPAFSTATAFANCECILTITGDIYLKYDASCNFNTTISTSGNTPIVGISKSDGTVAAGTHIFDWTLATPGPLAVVDATGYQQFTVPTGLTPFDLLGGVVLHFAPTGPSTYDVTNTTLGTCAPGTYPILATASTSVGTACSQPNGSIYELFTNTTATNPFDLSNTSITFVRSGTSYQTIPGPGLDPTYSTSGTIETLAADDVLIDYPLAMGSFSFGNQPLTTVRLSTNGYLGITTLAQTFNAVATTFHTGGLRVAGYWKDLLPNTTTAPIYIENTASMFRATWQAVPQFSGAGTDTFQIQLDQATGNITISFGACTGVATVSPPLVGIVGPATATNLGNDNLATAGVANAIGPRNITGGFSAMAHTTSLASIGVPFVMTTTCPTNNFGFGSWLVGFSNPNIPVDAIFGAGQAPGCNIYSDFAQDLDLLFGFTAGSPSFSKTIPVPFNTALAGIIIFTQAAVFVPVNPLGVITSNGRTQTVGL